MNKMRTILIRKMKMKMKTKMKREAKRVIQLRKKKWCL